MPNNYSYVDFISDEDLFECIDHVFSVYAKKSGELSYKNFVKNKLDPFKTMFDMEIQNLRFEEWIKVETNRQIDKALSNAIGTFHEMVISKSTDLKRDLKRKSTVDLYNEQKTIFVEVKNKHNTVKGEDRKNVFNKLQKIVDNYEGSICYYLVVIDKKSVKKPWKINTKQNGQKITLKDERIIHISIDRFYEEMLGDKYAFKKFVDELPKAIKDYLKQAGKHQKEDLDGKQKELVNHLKKTSKENKRKSKNEIMYQGFESSEYLGF